MALNYTNIVLRLFRPSVSTTLIRLKCEKVFTMEVVNTIDVLDQFTSKLAKEKALKWGTVKPKQTQKLNNCSLDLVSNTELEIRANKSLTNEKVDETLLLLINCDNEGNVKLFLKKCHESQVCPTFNKLINFLDSKTHSVEVIYQVKSLVKHYAHDLYKSNGSLNHYLAEAYWLNGEIIKAVELLEMVYYNHSYLRRRLRLMLRYLVDDITNKSEAALVTVTKFAENIYNNYKDPTLLVSLWQTCFLSEWYSDQKLSVDLLERNPNLCKELDNMIPYVVAKALKMHQVDVVYRLLEVLLKYSMQQHYSGVIVALFNYKFIMGDLKSCSEIIQWSVINNVTLPQEISTNFLQLLLRKSSSPIVLKKQKTTPKVKLKF